MSEQDASSDPQNDSTSEALPPSGTPNNQANSAPVTESKKLKNPLAGSPTKEAEKEESAKNTLQPKILKKIPQVYLTHLRSSQKKQKINSKISCKI